MQSDSGPGPIFHKTWTMDLFPKKKQNTAGVDYRTPDPWPRLASVLPLGSVSLTSDCCLFQRQIFKLQINLS